MRELGKKRLALLMHTSRTQVDRVLDPTHGNVTLETLQRAAAVVGRRVELALTWSVGPTGRSAYGHRIVSGGQILCHADHSQSQPCTSSFRDGWTAFRGSPEKEPTGFRRGGMV